MAILPDNKRKEIWFRKDLPSVMANTDQQLKFDTLCSDCGQAAHFLTCLKKYGNKPRKLAFEISTWHQDTCDICGETKQCTEGRDFFYPDEQAMECIKKYLEEK